MSTLLCPPCGAAIELNVLPHAGERVRALIDGRMAHRFHPGDEEPLAAAVGFGAYSRQVLLDLSNVTELHTSGLSWLLSVSRSFEQAGGKLVIHSLSPVVRNVIRVLNLRSVLTIADSEQDAENLLAGGNR